MSPTAKSTPKLRLPPGAAADPGARLRALDGWTETPATAVAAEVGLAREGEGVEQPAPVPAVQAQSPAPAPAMPWDGLNGSEPYHVLFPADLKAKLAWVAGKRKKTSMRALIVEYLSQAVNAEIEGMNHERTGAG